MAERKVFLRFSIPQRLEHWVMMLAFVMLAVTGLPQKYAGAGWAETIIAVMGGIETIRFIHHIAAVVILLEAVYHVVAVAYRMFVKRTRLSMLPVPRDILDTLDVIRFNLGMAPKRPALDRYSYEEKVEYWAMVWGTVLMAITGFMMWNPIATTRFLPGDFVPAAKAAHGAEAVLAVLAILTWHFYSVHIRRFNKSMFVGRLSAEEMHEDHALELARLEAGQDGMPLLPEVKARRERLFIPIAAILTIALLLGLYTFVNLEQTAITTLPKRVTLVAFVPATATVAPIATATPIPTAMPTKPPTPTLAPTHTPVPGATATPVSADVTPLPTATSAEGVVSFAKDILPVFNAACKSCHGKLGGLSLENYDAVLKGGTSGKNVVPNDAEGSLLVKKQRSKHAGNLSAEQLELVVKWIAAGAPNN